MGLFSRFRRPRRPPSLAQPLPRAERQEALEQLAGWVAGRRGVEVYVEPATAVTGVTVLLVAHDGEFTRRRVGTTEVARDFAREHRLPVYDATVVGYPQRMRDWSHRQRAAEQDGH
ncbi:oxidoreductase [Nakamurella leprariae]|uniref:Oxidoreductase n=1 Tax=Nakamurella leprariae TaxID=2803911 RepID=A0A938YG06_9ACTN|nr:oxidoreductase [Nakamurella leprariae]MBM9467133.1 oxidoreductase [Nakamurella leprariae]